MESNCCVVVQFAHHPVELGRNRELVENLLLNLNGEELRIARWIEDAVDCLDVKLPSPGLNHRLKEGPARYGGIST